MNDPILNMTRRRRGRDTTISHSITNIQAAQELVDTVRNLAQLTQILGARVDALERKISLINSTVADIGKLRV